MKYLSVCSGIEAATVAWHGMAWQAFAFSEIDKFPCAVLAHHYPNVPNLGDMTKFKEWPDADVDVLVGGTPCQSFSVAGLRKGLDDPRGNLMLTYLAIADKYRPAWLVWENVPGVLSSNGGRDFASFLRGLAELGYGFAYRILDAQYLGVAQRRRRVFVVGHLGDWRRAAAVLFERHSLQGHPAPSREAGKRPAPCLDVRAGRSSETTFHTSGGLVEGPAHSLRAQAQAQASCRADSETYIPVPHADISPAIKARDSKGVSSDSDSDSDGDGAILVPMVAPTLRAGGNATGGNRPYGMDVDTCDLLIPTVAHSLRADGFDASEDGTGRGTPLVPIAIQGNMIGRADTAGPAGSGIAEDGISFTLTKSDVHAIAFDCKTSGQNGFGVGKIASTMRSMGHTNSHQNGGGHLAVAIHENQRAEISVSDTAGSLKCNGGKPGQGYPATFNGMQVRRLMPIECCRLQGFPDDYLDIIYNGKPAKDGPKYKALGNSMAVPVMTWIGKRIQMVEDIDGK